jgi:hypothetical protein
MQTVSNFVEIQQRIIGHDFSILVGAPDDLDSSMLRGQAAGILSGLPSVIDGVRLFSN